MKNNLINYGEFGIQFLEITEIQYKLNSIEKLNKSDSARSFMLLKCYKKKDKHKILWEKALCYNSTIVKPKFIFMDNIMVIGIDFWLMSLNLTNGKLIEYKELFSVFLKFYYSNNSNYFAICELEIIAIAKNGKIKWECGFPDLLTKVSLKNNLLLVQDFNEDKYGVDIITGKSSKLRELQSK